MSRLLRFAAATTVAAIPTLMLAGHASAHANSVACVDQATSTWRVTNDYPLSETFTSLEGPSGSVASGNGSFTDVVYNGDTLTVTGTWTDGFMQTTVGSGDCTPEVIVTTTTEAPTTTTELVTTTTEQETTTSTTSTTPTTSPPSSSTSTTTTTVPTVTTVPTSTQPSTTTTPTTSSEPATSSSVATTSTTSPESSTTSPPSTPPSSTPPAPSSTVPECSDNPNTPEDDCAPICQPVTQPDGTNSCSTLPATGSDVVWLIPAAVFSILCGAVIVLFGRRGTVR